MGDIIRMPRLGMQMQQGTLIEWHVSTGDAVDADDLLAEIESEKSVGEIRAQSAGVVRVRYLREGEAAEPGAALAIVAPAGEDIDELRESVDADPAAAGAEDAPGEEPSGETGDASDVRATPRAKKRARELGVDLAAVEGSGPDGAVTADDIDAATAASEEAGVESGEEGGDEAPTGTSGPAVRERRQLVGVRRTIAERLQRSHREAPHVTEHRDVDVEPMLAALEACREEYDPDLSLVDLLVAAVAETLTEHPEFNATLEDDTHVLYDDVNVCVAVDTDAGLVAPVIREVGSKSLTELAESRRDVTESAQNGEYAPEDLTGGTFTVSNLGVLGVDSFTPIINPPQVAILGIGRPHGEVVGDGADSRTRRHVTFSLSFDHRAVDGADAARFLETLAGLVGDPASVLPEGVEVDALGDDTGAEPTAADGEEALPHRTAAARVEDGLSGTARVANGSWRFDEPETVGGTGTAPTPVDHFLGSLASCLAVTCRLQADKYDEELTSTAVEVEAGPETGRIEDLAVTITVRTDADDDTVERVVEASERACYVSDLLRDDLAVDVTWTREA